MQKVVIRRLKICRFNWLIIKCMLYCMLLHDQCLFLLNFAFLVIFPETAWRVMNYRQATHAFCLFF